MWLIPIVFVGAIILGICQGWFKDGEPKKWCR